MAAIEVAQSIPWEYCFREEKTMSSIIFLSFGSSHMWNLTVARLKKIACKVFLANKSVTWSDLAWD